MADCNYAIEGWEWDIILASHDTGLIPVHGENLFIPHPSIEEPVSNLIASNLPRSQSINTTSNFISAKLKDWETGSSSPSALNMGNTSESSLESSVYNYNHEHSETILDNILHDVSIKKKKKREIRLECPNFLAGIIPCACPELDALFAADLEVEENAKKKLKIGARCQVPICDVDISHLKSYHRRHRVCLRCANSPKVILKDLPHRYCQQCGIFHLLSDFDEDKRSCRRKLERHNKRRRRRPVEEREEQYSGDNVNYPNVEECALDSANQGTENQCTIDDSSTRHGEELISSNDINLDEQFHHNIDNAATTLIGVKQLLPKTLFMSTHQTRDADYVSPCPTGRISFKLYDWNPADFPRILRQQIFEWLANMPVELEGYIRSGCIILTFFITMPEMMWDNAIDGWICHMENLLLWQGTRILCTSQISLQMKTKRTHIQDGRVMNPDQKENLAPYLVDLYPPCLEAGCHTYLYICGFNISHAHFFLSFGEHYLECSNCDPVTTQDENFPSLPVWETIENLEICKITVVCPDMENFGPAFAEVNTDNGISNFIPVLVADKCICTEINSLISNVWSDQEGDNASQGQLYKAELLKPQWCLDVLVDLGWTLSYIRKHMSLNKAAIQKRFVDRLQNLLAFSLEHKLGVVTDRLVEVALKAGIIRSDGRQYIWNIEENSTSANNILMNEVFSPLNLKAKESSSLSLLKTEVGSNSFIKESHNLEDVPVKINLASYIYKNPESQLVKDCIVMGINERVPLLDSFNWPPQRTRYSLNTKKGRLRQIIVGAASVTAVCVGMCFMLGHPHEVVKTYISLRQCFWGSELS